MWSALPQAVIGTVIGFCLSEANNKLVSILVRKSRCHVHEYIIASGVASCIQSLLRIFEYKDIAVQCITGHATRTRVLMIAAFAKEEVRFMGWTEAKSLTKVAVEEEAHVRTANV